MAFWTASAILLVLAYFVLESKALSEPITKCYVLDRENYLYDFTSLKGQVFTHSLQESSSTFTLRLCQDVFVSSSSGGELVNFGKFRPDYLFSPSTDVKFSFEQGYTYGELHGCRDHGFDLSGRSTLVRITCDKCPDGSTCADASAGGCICSVEYDSTSKCSIAVVLALKCGASLGRVYKGLSVGQGPRTHEVVRDGLTQWGYESTAHADYSFTTGESEHFLYLSALSATASLLPVPSFSVSPSKGLEVKLAGSAATGAAATVESPSVLKVYWRCNKVRAEPYQVEVSLAIEAHAPVTFLLAKHCTYRQHKKSSGSAGWATFGGLSFITILGLMLFCCAGFVYKTHAQDKRGLDALPGMPAISSCLDSASNLVVRLYPFSGGRSGSEEYAVPVEAAAYSSEHDPHPPGGGGGGVYGSVAP